MAVGTQRTAPESPTVPPDRGESPHRDATLSTRLRGFVVAVRDGDESMVEELVLRVSGSRRAFAPLALVVGGFAMLFTGLKLLFTNWRLTVIQALPALWIWLVMCDLKAHVLHGKSFHVLRGPILIPIVLLIAAITAASFYLNAVFGFAIVRSGAPKIRPAVAQARAHLRVILCVGCCGRAAAWAGDGGRHALGASLVRDLAERHARRDDGVLCRGPVAADWR